MSRRKKPGTPGKTTVPREVVSAVTKYVQAEFKKRGFADYLDVFVVAQQCFIYVETGGKVHDAFGRPLAKPRVNTSSTAHTPLGRLKYVGSAERWELHPSAGATNSGTTWRCWSAARSTSWWTGC